MAEPDIASRQPLGLPQQVPAQIALYGQAVRRRRRIRRPPTNTAPTPTTANSSTSAPVKGRLLDPVGARWTRRRLPATPNGKGLPTDGVLEVPAMDGVTLRSRRSFIVDCTQSAAPATADAMARGPPPNLNQSPIALPTSWLPSFLGAMPLRTPSQPELSCTRCNP